MQVDNPSCRLLPPTVPLMAFSALWVALLLCAGTAQAGMYRWVDANGRVHYSDTLPSSYQKSGAAEMSKQGVVIKRTQSEAERRVEAERKAAEKRVQQDQQKQAQLDRALTSTNTTEAEIDLARDRALDNHKLMIKGAEIRVKVVETNLAELKARVATIKKSGRPIAPNLKEQVDQANRERLELKRNILNNEEALVKVREKYDADKQRFRDLAARK